MGSRVPRSSLSCADERRRKEACSSSLSRGEQLREQGRARPAHHPARRASGSLEERLHWLLQGTRGQRVLAAVAVHFRSTPGSAVHATSTSWLGSSCHVHVLAQLCMSCPRPGLALHTTSMSSLSKKRDPGRSLLCVVPGIQVTAQRHRQPCECSRPECPLSCNLSEGGKLSGSGQLSPSTLPSSAPICSALVLADHSMSLLYTGQPCLAYKTSIDLPLFQSESKRRA